MRREIRPFHTAGSPLVAAVAVGRVPEASARIAASHLAALQVSVRIGELSPLQAALQAAEAVEYATGTLEVLYV
ncbi:hypothetical protein GCM10007886_34040 [Methylobacterium gregans]|uniref:Uncharacterized protein n=1 Tax=Methylobacterium gregans TaxID=374424 RepID=A0AA37HPS9_9HYPH|nr:hypothetical protein [Methylobacterium gregans]MDQ0522472.1 hypothetical protein [Methylobacterium gregans]GJD79525.1 hypothetical protein NBEOAGPD_2754 [Methylobacterium gregans]GLS55220.1 hypothetical protein GCM10007886_34040 [Methylobacterium gregans]